MREIPSFTVNAFNLSAWLDEHRTLIIYETVDAAEYLVHNSVDSVKILEIVLKDQIVGETKLIFGLNKDDIDDAFSKLMRWCIAEEEYEIAQRIKILQQHIDGQSSENHTSAHPRLDD